MTREFLERYQGILQDIAAIKAEKVTDTVSASSLEFPYTQHTEAVRGVPYSERLQELYTLKDQIEAFIEGVPDDTVRAIMRYRIKKDLSWNGIAAKFGGRLSVDTIKKRYYNFFERDSQNSPNSQKSRLQ